MMTTRMKLILFLAAAVFIVYSNSLGGEFLSDDNYFIVKNVAIRNIANIPSFFTNPASVAFSALAEDVYRPVTATSYAIDYFLWFLNVFGYHLENVLIHAANAILLLLFVEAITGDIFVAFFAGLFFACHPVQTEVVSWISGRASLLFLLFYLGALLGYVRFLAEKKARWLLASVCLYAVSLFSKEMAVTLPVILILYDTHFGPPEDLRRRAARYLPYIALTALFIAVRGLALSRVSQCGWWGGHPYANALSSIAVFPDYLKLLVYPSELCAFYTPVVARSLADPRVLAALGFFILTAAALPIAWKRSRPASFAILWFFVTILPVSNIVPLRALMAERFLYIPSIGFCLLAALGIGAIRRAHARYAAAVATVLAAALALGYSVKTMARNDDWKDSISLSRSIVRVQPLNAWGYTSLGTSYIGREQYREAVKPLLKAMVLTKDYSAPRTALGFCYLQLREYDDAVAVLTEALRFEPRNLEAIISLGVAYAELKKHDLAIAEFNKAIAIDPTFVSAYLNLGTAYEQTAQPEKAFAAYRQVLLHTNSLQDIGIAYIRLGDLSLRVEDAAAARAYYGKTIEAAGSKYEELKAIALDRLKMLDEFNDPSAVSKKN